MTAKQYFKMEYSHLRKQLNKVACNRPSWIKEFIKRGGVSRAAAFAVCDYRR